MPDLPKSEYNYDEVRRMLFWESTQNGVSHSEAKRASDAVSDTTITMWENAGRNLQKRVEDFRQATA